MEEPGRRKRTIYGDMKHQRPLRTPLVQFEAEAKRLKALSAREREVSILVAEGLTNKQIGQRLFISPTTVRHHLTSVFNKLGISNRFELIVICYRHQIVVPPVVGDPSYIRDRTLPKVEQTKLASRSKITKSTRAAQR